MTLNKIQAKLRQANRKNYILYLFCNFIAAMLITAYSAMMYSPTVLQVLPEGGDSRKQMMAVFVLAAVGCVAFTVYGTSLFFRMKAREIGTFMALGASRKRLTPMVLTETTMLGGLAAVVGTVAGIPFAWLIWQGFALFVVDSPEMKLRFDYSCLFVSVIFIIIITLVAFLMALRYLKRTNIIDVIHEEHKNEKVPRVGHLGGAVGIILLLAGAICGYAAPGVYMEIFSAYSPGWLNLLYLPVFIGLYLILLHTVVHGWGRHKNPYKGIISRSMMRFQGKQTVNNMLVVSVLIAGACFGIFYIPITIGGQITALQERPYQYMMRWPADQQALSESDVSTLADQYQLGIKDWREAEYIVLAMDGVERVEEQDGSFHDEYVEENQEGKFISESAIAELTGQPADIPAGSYYAVSNREETGLFNLNMSGTVLTNMSTGQKIGTAFEGLFHYSQLTDTSGGYYILDDRDYQEIAAGLTADWKGKASCFNVSGTDSYEFANTLFDRYVDSFGESYQQTVSYDRVQKSTVEKAGEVYWGDTDLMTKISYSNRDAADFRMFWRYMPRFAIIDRNDTLKNYAVYFMMFLFIAIICITASMIICYTRCLTLAINNAYVFADLKRLGAPPAFLKKEIRGQASKVFAVPYLVETIIMIILYSMILYANDDKLSSSEIMGMGLCLALILALTLVVWGIYRNAVGAMQKRLQI